MRIDVNEMPSTAKLWIYQADKKWNSQELKVITKHLDHFTSIWDSHGASVKGAYELIVDQFILLYADNTFNAVSGCSIDKSVQLIKLIETETSLQLMDKSFVAFKTEDGVATAKFNEVKAKVASGEITPETLVYDVSLSERKSLAKGWPLAAKNTWVKRFL